MKIIKLSIFLILAGMALNACHQPDTPGRTTVSGSFPAFKGKSIVLNEIDIRKTIPLDTATLSETGEFKFKFDRDSAGMYLLKLDNKSYLTLILDGERKIRVTSGATVIRGNYQVEGSEQSQRYAEYEAALEKNRKVVDSLAQAYNKGQSSAAFNMMERQMEGEYMEIFQAQKKLTEKYIEDNCGSLSALLVLNRRFGQRRILTEEEDGRYFLLADSCLAAKYPGNKHVAEQKKRVEAVRRQMALQERLDQKLGIGQKAPDITLETPEGKSISLYSLQGKKVIVYFWASWDKNSREANKQMVRVYDKIRTQGVEVYAVGLESYKDTWTGAIKADQLDWINVTDYLNLQSGARSMFNVPDDLPYFYLLDKDMLIRYKGNDIAELVTRVQQL